MFWQLQVDGYQINKVSNVTITYIGWCCIPEQVQVSDLNNSQLPCLSIDLTFTYISTRAHLQ